VTNRLTDPLDIACTVCAYADHYQGVHAEIHNGAITADMVLAMARALASDSHRASPPPAPTSGADPTGMTEASARYAWPELPDNDRGAAPQASAPEPPDELSLRLQLAEARKTIDGAYRERTALVALLAKWARERGGVAGLGEHEASDASWDPAWRTIVFIEIPTATGHVQASWHVSLADRDLVEHLPPYSGAWDGHTTEQKYGQISALSRAATPPVRTVTAPVTVADALRDERVRAGTHWLKWTIPGQGRRREATFTVRYQDGQWQSLSDVWVTIALIHLRDLDAPATIVPAVPSEGAP